MKTFCEDLFFVWRALALVSLASSIPVLGLESVCPRKGCPWPRIFFVSLALSLVSSISPLVITEKKNLQLNIARLCCHSLLSLVVF